jgi:hypothetical protein
MDHLLVHASCGMHAVPGLPGQYPYFVDSGTWHLHAEADNCCGGKGSGDFDIVLTQ